MKTYNLFVLLFLAAALFGCKADPFPRPRGYFHIDFPKKEYHNFDTDCGFSFELPNYARFIKYSGPNEQPCSFNLVFPSLKATLYLTHLNIEDDLEALLEDAYTMAHKHDAKANSLKRTILTDEQNQKFGLSYSLGGDVATPYQFYMHDSTANFLRGSLYFKNIPNADSLAPSIEFIRADLDHFLDTFQWPKQ